MSFDWSVILEENKDVIGRSLRIGVPALATLLAAWGGSDRLATVAGQDLAHTEHEQARKNDAVNYRGYVEDTIEKQARCDQALVSHHHHRADEGDYGRMVKACHSAGEIEEEEDDALPDR